MSDLPPDVGKGMDDEVRRGPLWFWAYDVGYDELEKLISELIAKD